MTKMQTSVATAANKGLDAKSREMIYQGVNISQLAAMFDMDNRTVSRKIRMVGPITMRGGYPIYRIKDVAPYLVEFQGNIEEHIRKMDPDDLPPQLNQRFWAGLREKSRYQQEQGELWETEEVLAHFGSTFKTLQNELRMLSDRLRRETELTTRQREILEQEIDGALTNARASLIEQYEYAAGSGTDDSADGEGEDSSEETGFEDLEDLDTSDLEGV